VISDFENKQRDKKKLALMTVAALVALAIITTLGIFILKKVKTDSPPSEAGAAQEQFVGQVETSQQLQAECQVSADVLVKSRSLQEAISEYKKHVDNCKEVYFTIEEKTDFRNEGMYPDLAIDIISKLAVSDKGQAIEFLNYAKKLPAWQYYMGPIVCDSNSVLSAYEEALKNSEEKICVKAEEFSEKIYSELKNKNFSVLSSTLNHNQVVWLGPMNSDVGCPEKISSVIKTVQKSLGNSQIKPAEPKQESTNLNVIFTDNSDDDKVALEFGDVNGCFQLKSATVFGLQINE
jgi:hypothetical protein